MMGGSPCPVEVMKQVMNRMGVAECDNRLRDD